MPDEVEAKYVECMGPDLGSLFNRLQSECTMLHSTWGQFVELFATSEQRVLVLEWSASYFFDVVRKVFLEATLLRICRLTDPAKTQKKENVSLARLASLVDQEILADISQALERITKTTAFARDWRNRHIAHHDFALSFDPAAEPLATVTKQMIDAAIAEIGELLNKILFHYNGSTIAFEHLIARGQADDLLQTLNDAFEDEKDYLHRLDTNTVTTDDIYRVPRKRI